MRSAKVDIQISSLEVTCWIQCVNEAHLTKQKATTEALYTLSHCDPFAIDARGVRRDLAKTIQSAKTTKVEQAAAILALGRIQPADRAHAVPFELFAALEAATARSAPRDSDDDGGDEAGITTAERQDELIQVCAILAISRLSPVDAYKLLPQYLTNASERIETFTNTIMYYLQIDPAVQDELLCKLREEVSDHNNAVTQVA
jgi:hypothetical protein